MLSTAAPTRRALFATSSAHPRREAPETSRNLARLSDFGTAPTGSYHSATDLHLPQVGKASTQEFGGHHGAPALPHTEQYASRGKAVVPGSCDSLPIGPPNIADDDRSKRFQLRMPNRKLWPSCGKRLVNSRNIRSSDRLRCTRERIYNHRNDRF